MKSTVLKSAWQIFKMGNVTFSKALTLAWSYFKKGFKAVIVKMNRLVKSKGLGYETIYFNQLAYLNITVKRESINNAGAIHWYDGKTFNND